MSDKNNSIINSLKRLERVGSETSRVTAKLKRSCEEVAKMIISAIRESGIIDEPTYDEAIIHEKLPTYLIEEKKFSWNQAEIANAKKRHQVNLLVTYQGEYRLTYWNEYQSSGHLDDKPSRDDALSFAYIVNAGLIDAISDWIEAEKVKSEQKIKVFETASVQEIIDPRD